MIDLSRYAEVLTLYKQDFVAVTWGNEKYKWEAGLCPKSCANVVWPVVGCGLSALTAWCHRAGTCPGSGACSIGWR